jgi:hypothetical protein
VCNDDSEQGDDDSTGDPDRDAKDPSDQSADNAVTSSKSDAGDDAQYHTHHAEKIE